MEKTTRTFKGKNNLHVVADDSIPDEFLISVDSLFVGVRSVERNGFGFRVVTLNSCARLSDVANVKETLNAKDVEILLPHDNKSFGLIYQIVV